SDGRCLRRAVNASRPPADAPMPTTGNSASGLLIAGGASRESLASRFSLLASRFSLLASRFSLLASRFSLLASRFSLLASPLLASPLLAFYSMDVFLCPWRRRLGWPRRMFRSLGGLIGHPDFPIAGDRTS